MRKAEVTGGLEHPGIVPVYCLGSDDDGRPFYAMRFIRGETLKEAIGAFHAANNLERGPGRTGARPAEAAEPVYRRLQRNRLRRHGRGVVHRDLKPANIVVGNYGETLVVDWGLAKAVGHADPSRTRRTDDRAVDDERDCRDGTGLGPRHAGLRDPRRVAGDLDRLGPRSDVYSLGATLYCILTGRPPFDEVEVGLVLLAVQAGEFAPAQVARPFVDPALESVCLKAMARAPRDRYDSARSWPRTLKDGWPTSRCPPTASLSRPARGAG